VVDSSFIAFDAYLTTIAFVFYLRFSLAALFEYIAIHG